MIRERQDIVYRGATTVTAVPTPVSQPGEPAQADIVLLASPSLLFRYSALTFNSHRIHYDKDYARDVEGFGGLVVQGPLQATLLLNHAASSLDTFQLDFSFRSSAPLIADQVFGLCSIKTNGGLKCWTRGADATTAMTVYAVPLKQQ